MNVTSNTIAIKLVFVDPILVSNSDAVKHNVYLTIADSSANLFVSKTGKQLDPQYQVLLSKIPA